MGGGRDGVREGCAGQAGMPTVRVQAERSARRGAPRGARQVASGGTGSSPCPLDPPTLLCRYSRPLAASSASTTRVWAG